MKARGIMGVQLLGLLRGESKVRCLLVALLATACDPESIEPAPLPDLIFAEDFRSAYTLVRGCRSSIEHGGLGASIAVFANDIAQGPYAALWAEPPTANALPAGSLLVKEVFANSDCQGEPMEFVAMLKKGAGYHPSGGDWHWQWASADFETAQSLDGRVGSCLACHDGSQGDCTGFGGSVKDFTCTMRLSTDP